MKFIIQPERVEYFNSEDNNLKFLMNDELFVIYTLPHDMEFIVDSMFAIASSNVPAREKIRSFAAMSYIKGVEIDVFALVHTDIIHSKQGVEVSKFTRNYGWTRFTCKDGSQQLVSLNKESTYRYFTDTKGIHEDIAKYMDAHLSKLNYYNLADGAPTQDEYEARYKQVVKTQIDLGMLPGPLQVYEFNTKEPYVYELPYGERALDYYTHNY